jgi:hypothetical protein
LDASLPDHDACGNTGACPLDCVDGTKRRALLDLVTIAVCAGERGIRLSVIGFEDLLQLVHDLALFGEAAGLRFGEEVAVTEGDLEDPAATGNDGDAVREVFRVIVKDVFRQPGGFFDVPSRGAVLNPDRGEWCGLGHRSLLSL